MERVQVIHGDSREVLKTLADNSIDSCVCDPPYALVSITKRFGKPNAATAKGNDAYMRASSGFMGQQWDTGETAFDPEFWRDVLRVLKPGAHLVAFSGTRTYHRMACAIEDAGFEIRDQLQWLFGSGFPKSHKAADGWGSALKPASEPICLARKALSGTIKANFAQHGTGALNIDGCRVQNGGPSSPRGTSKLDTGMNEGWARPWMEDREEVLRRGAAAMDRLEKLGRWPANVIHDGSEEVLAHFPDSDGQQSDVVGSEPSECHSGVYSGPRDRQAFSSRSDSGSAARFFYSAKADADDRLGSKHPTVKPVDLMRWLVRLVTPPIVIEYVCESCQKVFGDEAKMQDMREAPQDMADILLNKVPGDCPDNSASTLPTLRQDPHEIGASEILLDDMPSGVKARGDSNEASEAMRAMRENLQSEGKCEQVLFSKVRGNSDGPCETNTAHKNDTRILASLQAGTPNVWEERVCHGASDIDGGKAEPSINAKRSRASHKREQGGQPLGKSHVDDEGGARQSTEVAEKPYPQVSALPETDSSQQLCKKCGGGLKRIESRGLVLDPFAGSGSTGIAAIAEGMRAILIERESQFVADIHTRLEHIAGRGPLTDQLKQRNKKSSDDDGPLFARAAE